MIKDFFWQFDKANFIVMPAKYFVLICMDLVWCQLLVTAIQ